MSEAATPIKGPAVIQLVDRQDRPTGTAEKLAAHQQGLLHRAFSVFIWRQGHSEMELLMHQRALGKYHSPGLWTNSCCSHPLPEEALQAAAHRRIAEELGLRTTAPLTHHGFFIYRKTIGELIEHELDHVLSLQVDTVALDPDPDEIGDWCWQPLTELQSALQKTPHRFTCWLPAALAQFLNTDKKART